MEALVRMICRVGSETQNTEKIDLSSECRGGNHLKAGWIQHQPIRTVWKSESSGRLHDSSLTSESSATLLINSWVCDLPRELRALNWEVWRGKGQAPPAPPPRASRTPPRGGAWSGQILREPHCKFHCPNPAAALLLHNLTAHLVLRLCPPPFFPYISVPQAGIPNSTPGYEQVHADPPPASAQLHCLACLILVSFTGLNPRSGGTGERFHSPITLG